MQLNHIRLLSISLFSIVFVGCVKKSGISSVSVAGHNAKLVDTPTSSVIGLFSNGSSCGAARIGRNYLVTAGHCIGGPADAAATRLAYVDPDSDNQVTGFAKAKIVAQALFPKFSGDGAFDLGLIAVVADGGGSDPFPGVPFAAIGGFFDGEEPLVQKGDKLLKAGFGVASPADEAAKIDIAALKLRYVPLAVSNLDASRAELTYTMGKDGAGTCQGDFGNPAFLTSSSQGLLLISLTDRGPEVEGRDTSCDQDSGIDEDVRYYRQWMSGVDQMIHTLAKSDVSLAGIAALQLTAETTDTSGAMAGATFVVSTAGAAAAEAGCVAADQDYDPRTGNCTTAKARAPRAAVAGSDSTADE